MEELEDQIFGRKSEIILSLTPAAATAVRPIHTRARATTRKIDNQFSLPLQHASRQRHYYIPIPTPTYLPTLLLASAMVRSGDDIDYK